MRVQNRKIIRKLTWRMLQAARLRNVVAVIAIALTATLFTTVFALGGNIVESLQNATMRQVGMSAHGGLKYLTQAQYDNFKESPLIKDISYNIIIAFAENEALKEKQNEIRYSEDDAARWGFSYPTVGDMPRSGKELACSTITLDMLGIPYELGKTVPLEFTVHGQKYREEFTLCGFWPGDDVMVATQIWLSREYTDSIISVPENPSWEGGFDGIAGAINADVWFANSLDIEAKMDALLAERGYEPGEIHTGVNWAYVGDELDVTTMLIAGLAVALILFSGYLIIYSIFTISVSGDIRFYGLLKTIGATGRQLRRVVRMQALALSLFGIPLGFLLGWALGYGLTPVMMDMTNLRDAVSISANPLIFVFAGVFSLLTVFISCRKPGRIAARVSPVEAVRYTEGRYGKRREKRARRVTPLAMARANVTRSPRKLVVVTLSLSLSLILLNSVYSAVRGFDMEKYLENQMAGDFYVADYSVFSPMTTDKNYQGVDDDVLAAVAALPGLEAMANIYFYDDYLHQFSPQAHENMKAVLDYLTPRIEKTWPHAMKQVNEAKETGVAPLHIYGAGQLAAEIILQGMQVDYALLSSGDYVVASHVDVDYDEEIAPVYGVGDKVPLLNKAGELREFTVLAIIPDYYPYSLSAQHGHMIETEIVMADNIYQDFYGESAPMLSMFNVADAQLPAAEAWLADYCENVQRDLDYRSREFYKGEFESMRRTYMVLGGALAFILALIGLLNFVNASFTSIFARRRELAMLQSVGMTGKQLQTMLFGEGLAHALLTILFAATAGTLLSRLIVQGIAGDIWFFQWNFSIAPLFLAAPLLLLACALIPLFCYRHMRRESVVERLRQE